MYYMELKNAVGAQGLRSHPFTHSNEAITDKKSKNEFRI